MKKKYLVYVDILGFEKLAEELAFETGFEEDIIRQEFFSIPLKEEIKKIKKEGIQISQGISEIQGSDNYVLMVDDISIVFKAVGRLTAIKIPHKDYGNIPLEIALDTKEIGDEVKVELINRKEIIEFLKNDIIPSYRHYYKNENKGKSIKETFVLLTPEFFNDLEPLDKKNCNRISHEGKTFYLSSLEKIIQRCKVFEFLDEIGIPGSKLYNRIDDLYVPPLEYEDIRKSLEKERIVFITGTAEYGKTYTAIRLLWEYFNKSHEPKWIKGGEERERGKVRERFEDIERELKPNHIIYFEDPFGKIKYEKREGLERKIGTIIDCVKNVKEAYVIITSREEVFKEFEEEHLSSVELKEFEKKLNIKKPSYNYAKTKEILFKWSESKDCKWLKNVYLKNKVLEYLKKERYLPTPLSIKGFVFSTIDIIEEYGLIKQIKEKSKETARSFAEEIENMSYDKILFLSFPFISSNFTVDFVKTQYEKLVKELKIDGQRIEVPLEFDQILDWFLGDKIAVGPSWDRKRLVLRFSHPSYSEALEYLLINKKVEFTWINEHIFSPVLMYLSEKDEATVEVAWTVAYNFDKLPEKVKNLLFQLSEKDKGAVEVAWAVAYNFDKLPEKVKNLLFQLSEKDEATWIVAWAVAYNFDKLPDKVQNLLFTLAEKDKAAGEVARAVVDNFDKLPDKVQNLLFKLSENDEAAWHVAWAVVQNFDKLPEKVRNLLFKLSEKDKDARAVVWAVARNFDKLPDKVRDELLLKLSEKDEAAGTVARAVARNFDKLPEEVRNELLLKLSEKDKSAGAVARAVADNFDKFPEKVRNELLLKLSKKGIKL
jgi:hypothetical protein